MKRKKKKKNIKHRQSGFYDSNYIYDVDRELMDLAKNIYLREVYEGEKAREEEEHTDKFIAVI